MFNRFGGVSQRPVGEGLHFFVPWLQVPYIYDIRTQPKVITTTTGTRDLQMVSLSLRLLYRPNESRLPVLHQTLGPDFAERVLPSIGNEVLKAVVARYDAESLLTQRDRVSQDIREHITQRAKNFDIELDDVAIVRYTYSHSLPATADAALPGAAVFSGLWLMLAFWLHQRVVTIACQVICRTVVFTVLFCNLHPT